jgi:hypothetical protein
VHDAQLGLIWQNACGLVKLIPFFLFEGCSYAKFVIRQPVSEKVKDTGISGARNRLRSKIENAIQGLWAKAATLPWLREFFGAKIHL